MPDDEYRVTTRLRRIDEDGETTVLEPGDVVVPTEAELGAFGDILEPVATDDDAADETDDRAVENTDADESTAEESEPSEESEESGPSEMSDDSESDDESESLSVDDIDAAEYNELRAMASEFDDVDGRQSADDLRAALREKVDE